MRSGCWAFTPSVEHRRLGTGGPGREEQGPPPDERLGLLLRSHLSAALDDTALEPGFSESTLPLPALTCHLTFLSHHLLRGAQNDGDCQDEYKQLAMEPLPLAFAEHA